jgi:ATP-binding cassette subfamily C protein
MASVNWPRRAVAEPRCADSQQYLHSWLNAVPALAQIDALVAECAAVAEPIPDADASAPLAANQAITLGSVTLRREGRALPALDAISVKLPARTTTASIGSSGAGKTTLADVLAGLLSPDAGVLTVDGNASTVRCVCGGVARSPM